MIEPGQVVSYWEMCKEEETSLQRGMNFRLRGGLSIILMNLRPDAPYADRVEDDGRTLVYEGHDASRTIEGPDPKTVDQPDSEPSGRPTQNGLFYGAALRYKNGTSEAERVKVYEKIRPGIWAYNGVFKLVDAWSEMIGGRRVYKFRLETAGEASKDNREAQLATTRMIPTWVKREVWKRDKGRCVVCGSKDNLHFDHIIPYSRGGSSLVPENIQLLCARHNLEKRANIQ